MDKQTEVMSQIENPFQRDTLKAFSPEKIKRGPSTKKPQPQKHQNPGP